MPAYGRRHSSQYLRIKRHHFLIDCGEATQLQLKRYRVKYQKIENVFISHLHGDHFLGLMGLISSMHLQHRDRELNIYGPPGLDEIITLQLKYSQTALRYKINFCATNPDDIEILIDDEFLTVRSIPLQHQIHCTGFLFQEKEKPLRLDKKKLPKEITLQEIAELKKGNDVYDDQGQIKFANKEYTRPPKKQRSYAYCSDTIYDPSLKKHLDNMDMLYHETTFLKDREQSAADTYHSTAEQAAMVAKASGVEKLIIGHFSARYKDITCFLDEARQIFKNTYLAKEGEIFELEE